MNRRNFLNALGLGGAAMVLDPEWLLWVPGRKTIFVPPAAKVTAPACRISSIEIDGEVWYYSETVADVRPYLEAQADADNMDTCILKAAGKFGWDHMRMTVFEEKNGQTFKHRFNLVRPLLGEVDG